MSAFRPAASGGGSGITPEQLAALVTDGELTTAEATLLAAVGTRASQTTADAGATALALTTAVSTLAGDIETARQSYVDFTFNSLLGAGNDRVAKLAAVQAYVAAARDVVTDAISAASAPKAYPGETRQFLASVGVPAGWTKVRDIALALAQLPVGASRFTLLPGHEVGACLLHGSGKYLIFGANTYVDGTTVYTDLVTAIDATTLAPTTLAALPHAIEGDVAVWTSAGHALVLGHWADGPTHTVAYLADQAGVAITSWTEVTLVGMPDWSQFDQGVTWSGTLVQTLISGKVYALDAATGVLTQGGTESYNDILRSADGTRLIGVQSGYLDSIDPATATTTRLLTMAAPMTFSSATWVGSTPVFLVSSSGDSRLVSMDLTTGEVTHIVALQAMSRGAGLQFDDDSSLACLTTDGLLILDWPTLISQAEVLAAKT